LEGNTPFLVAMSIAAAATTPPAKHLSSNRDTMRETERVGERERGETHRFLFLHREGSPL
jgi:exonuclease V gamma subunit